MQREIPPLLIINMHLNLGFRLSFGSLYIGGNEIIGGARRHALSKFTGVIGIELPGSVLPSDAADFHLDAVNGTIVFVVNRSVQECVRFFGVGFAVGSGRIRKAVREYETADQQ